MVGAFHKSRSVIKAVDFGVGLAQGFVQSGDPKADSVEPRDNP